MARTALVTGAHRFIGRHVSRHLASLGITVLALSHGNWSRSEWRNWGIADWHVSDITLGSFTTYSGDPHLIFHCAGSGSVAYALGHPYQDFQRHVSTALAVLEYARLYAPAANLVTPSSAAVYGHAQRFPMLEGDPVAPVSPYGVHKAISEQVCKSYNSQFGLSVAIVRLFSEYGIGLRKQLLWDACEKIRQREAHFAGTGNESRDWIYVTYAADLLVKASDHANANCPIANGGSGEPASVKEVLSRVAENFDDGCAPEFSGVRRPGDPARQLADISMALSWGWMPKVHWTDGVAQYVKCYQAGVL